MFIDSKQAFATGQILGATAVSENIIDLGVDRNIGPGESMTVMVSSSVDAGGTSPTLIIIVQTDDNEAFASPTDILTSLTHGDLVAGQKVVLPLGLNNERYLRLNFVTGGTTPSHIIDAYLQPYSMVDASTNYANAYDIV